MRVFIVVVGFVWGCGPSAYERAQQSLAELRDSLERQIVYSQCKPGENSKSRCGMLSRMQGWDGEEYAAYSLRCAIEDTCSDSVKQMYATLRSRYPRSNVAATQVCVKSTCESSPIICQTWFNIELCMLQSHNDDVYAGFHRGLAQANERFHIDAQQEQIDAVSRQRAFRAIGAGLQAFGAGMQQRPAYRAPVYQPQPEPVGGCSSDYACGFGQRCVKAAGSMSGFCAQEVNNVGTPTYSPPSAGSVMPGTVQCHFDTECGIGFRCVSDHCVR
jgi:hypothetical protein